MGNVIYILDFLDNNPDKYTRHIKLYDSCMDYTRTQLDDEAVSSAFPSEPTEEQIDAMEREFMAHYNDDVENR